MNRPETDRRLANGELDLPATHADPNAIFLCDGPPEGYDVEPMAFAVLDTVAESSLAGALVILDAALSGRNASGRSVSWNELARWRKYLKTRPRNIRWEEAARLADPAAESPGESATRAVIYELGFEVPTLQRELQLPSGRQVRFDGEWENQGVVMEFDGFGKYGKTAQGTAEHLANAYLTEKIREDEIRATGRDVVRVYWEDVRFPEKLRRKLTAKSIPRRFSPISSR